MTMTRITHIFNDASSLQQAGRTDSKDTFNVSGSSFALGAKTALAPQDGLSYSSFGQIVGRLHTSIIHKRPQILPMVEYTTALPRQRLIAVSTFFQQGFHSLYQRFHTAVKGLPQKRAVPHAFAHMQDLFGQDKQFASDSTHISFGLGQRLKISFQMCPTQLSQACKAIVAAPAVAVKNPVKSTEKLFGCRLPASSLH